MESLRNRYALVADIGGTNARFAVVDLHTLELEKISLFVCADFPSLADAIRSYQETHQLQWLKHAIIAIACPVHQDTVHMTNFHWRFSISGLKKELEFHSLHVINDFTAIAMSLPYLSDKDIKQAGAGNSIAEKPRVVLGAGTGLGVSTLVFTDEYYEVLPGEGGHMSWAAENEQEWFIQRFLADKYQHVSAERILSGAGLENLYQALAAYQSLAVPPLRAEEIAHSALSEKCPLAKAAVLQFFASMGAVAGNLALAIGAFGGVYIAGGIVPKLLVLLSESTFRERFEGKGRFAAYNRQIPTYIISAGQPGILGAAVWLKQYRIKKQTSYRVALMERSVIKVKATI